MARKRSIQLTAEERHESKIYKRKLRKYKQELPSSSGLADNTAASIGEQQKQHGAGSAKRKKRSDKQELSFTPASRLGDTAATGEPSPSDADVIYVTLQGEQSTVVAKKTVQSPPPPSLPEDEKRQYTFKSPYPQRFSIPENIVYYITRNIISYGSQRNLLQTCKLLFRMSKIVPVSNVENGLNNDVVLYSYSRSRANITYDFLKKLTIKLQIYGNISVGNQTNPYLASALAQRIYKCSPELLMIQYQNLTFGEIQILVGGNRLQKIFFTKNIVKNADGSITDFEKIFEAFSCKIMIYELPNKQHGIGKNTTKKIAELLESKENFCHLYVGNVPEIFDGQLFVRLIKPNIGSRIRIKFSDTVSYAYSNQLQQFIYQFYGKDDVPRIVFSCLLEDDVQINF